MYEILVTNKFKRDLRKCISQHKDIAKFTAIFELLETGMSLPDKNYDHNLSGNWDGHRECHIKPDWILIYRINENEKIIELVRMGSHSDLF